MQSVAATDRQNLWQPQSLCVFDTQEMLGVLHQLLLNLSLQQLQEQRVSLLQQLKRRSHWVFITWHHSSEYMYSTLINSQKPSGLVFRRVIWRLYSWTCSSFMELLNWRGLPVYLQSSFVHGCWPSSFKLITPPDLSVAHKYIPYCDSWWAIEIHSLHDY